MSENPLISVIVPAYNADRFIADAVSSALAQTYRPIEVIVVDDGSTDGTAEALQPLLPQIHYIRQENRGPAAARNRGIAEARGELMAFLDADDQWLPEKLERQWRFLLEHPDVALVHTDLHYLRANTGEVFYSPRPRHLNAGDCYPLLFFDFWATPSTILMKRECLERAGLFDEQIKGTEDYELCMRIARHFRFGYLDEPLVLYRLHDANLTRNDLKMREAELAAAHKMLAADAGLEAALGPRRVRRKLYELNFSIGYHRYQQGSMAQARRALAQAWRLRPGAAYCAALWLSTFLPARLARWLRRWKQKLSRGASSPADHETALRSAARRRLAGSPPVQISTDGPDPSG